MLQKEIIKIISLLLAVFFVSYGFHYGILSATETELPYSLLNVYLFHAIFSLLICIVIAIVAQRSLKYKDQLGFMYLFTMVFKVVFFASVFNNVLFGEIVLNKLDNFSLLVPIFIFLAFEVVIISKILNNIPVK